MMIINTTGPVAAMDTRMSVTITQLLLMNPFKATDQTGFLEIVDHFFGDSGSRPSRLRSRPVINMILLANGK
jgi:hypothetical protein